jgi:exonuclease I
VNIRCRLAPHILPSPQALVVTGVTPEQLTDPSLLSLFEFSQKIVALTEQWAPPPTLAETDDGPSWGPFYFGFKGV